MKVNDFVVRILTFDGDSLLVPPDADSSFTMGVSKTSRCRACERQHVQCVRTRCSTVRTYSAHPYISIDYSTRTVLRRSPVVGRLILEVFNESH